MVLIGQDPAPAGPVVTAFAAGGGFSVHGEVYEGLFLTPERSFKHFAAVPTNFIRRSPLCRTRPCYSSTSKPRG